MPVMIAKGTIVCPNTRIAKYTSIRNNVLIDGNTLRIGRYCSIANDVSIGIGNHPIEKISTSDCFYYSKWNLVKNDLRENINNKKTIIGNDVWIGTKAIVLSGVSIGHGVVIASGSVVTKDIPDYAVVGGVPAKVIKFRFNENIIDELLLLKWWNFDDTILVEAWNKSSIEESIFFCKRLIMLIRDDDISYFTTPQVLENVWGKWYGKVNILFAVTPFMVEMEEFNIKNREFSSHQLGKKEFDISKNTELIEYIKMLLSKGYIEIGLHGYNHRYIVNNNNLIAEYDVDDESLLYDKSLKAKAYLERLFHTKIDTFIPPDNAVSRSAMKVLSKSGFNKILRAFPIKYIDTKFSFNFIYFWLKRVIFKYKYNLVYSKSYFNGYLYEEASYLYKGQSLEILINDYKIFKKHNLPFTIATHYWELDGSMKENLDNFLESIINEK